MKRHHSFARRAVSFLLRPFALFRPVSPDPLRVARLAEIIASQPAQRHWLLVIASESPRVRRAMLARASQTLRGDLSNPEAADALEQLTDEPLLDAVIAALFRLGGMEPLPHGQSSGRSARVRLAELGERMQSRAHAPVAA